MFEKEQSLFEKLHMNKMNKQTLYICLLSKWYIKSYKKLNLINTYKVIAKSSKVNIMDLKKFEKVCIKVKKLDCDIKYFESCQEMELIPEFLKFKVPNLKIYSDSESYYKLALNKFIESVKKEKEKSKSVKLKLYNQLKTEISFIKFKFLIKKISECSLQKEENIKSISHNKKLFNLWMKRNKYYPNTIVNLSSYNLKINETNALMYGLNHNIFPHKVDEIKMVSNIDSQIRKICFKNNINLKFDTKNNLRKSTEKFIKSADEVCKSKINRLFHRTIKNLKNNKSIVICKKDKGTGTVIMNKNDYYDKLDSIIKDTKKFKVINFNIQEDKTNYCNLSPWINQERKVMYYCRKYIKNLVSDMEYKNIYPTGSQPGKLYGMAKVHKPNCPLRPVLSAINTPEYGLAKWLEKHLKPLLEDKYSTRSSKEFVEKVTSVKLEKTDFMSSLDIKSLYTQVPIKEVIKDILITVYEKENKSIFQNSNITKTVLKNMLNLCSNAIFLYNNKVLQQTDGVAMGSPLAPLLANWFVCRQEEKVLSIQNITPKFYIRYVDDIFAIFDSERKCDNFYTKMNNVHPNLKYTIEKPKIGLLPFLDVKVQKIGTKLQTSVYRKSTNTNMLINWNAKAPKNWKVGLIKCLLNRAISICNNYDDYIKETIKLKEIFQINCYPKYLVNKIIREFAKKKKSHQRSSREKQ